MSYTYAYPRAALSVDCVLLGKEQGVLKVLLIQRGRDPYKGCWALPGGFLELDEALEQAARRELHEETTLEVQELEQLGIYDAIDRDPRERVITVAFMAEVEVSQYRAVANDDASDARWFDVQGLPPLAFDHARILNDAQVRLRTRARR